MRFDYIPETQEFWEEFLMQGYGLGGYSGIPYQRGAGIGGLFKGLFRLVAPVLKRALPLLKTIGLDVGRRAVEAGADIIGDVSEGENLSSSAKTRLKQRGNLALGDVGKRVSDRILHGKGVGVRSGKKSIKRLRPMDIFDFKKGKRKHGKVVR